MLARESVRHPGSSARQIQVAVGGPVSAVSISTIKRSLIRRGQVAYRPTKSPCFTAEKMRVRLQWCKIHRTWTVEDWKKVRKENEGLIVKKNNTYHIFSQCLSHAGYLLRRIDF
jgi:transposase